MSSITTHSKRHVLFPRQLEAHGQDRAALRGLAGSLRAGREMGMAAVAQERYLVAVGDPSREGISVADLPVKARFRLLYGSCYPGIEIPDMLAHLVHVSVLEP